MPPKDNWKIDPKRTAMVTIDLQRAFLELESPSLCRGGNEILPRVNELTALCRRVGIPVIHVCHILRADLSDIGLLQEMRPRGDSEWEVLEGRKGAQFSPDLHIEKSDYIVPKISYSALIDGSSGLERLLRGMGRDSFIICGVATDVCVGTTTSCGMMLGFRVFFVGDLTRTFNEERQKIALEVINRHFARVMTFEQVKAALEQLAPKR